MSDGYTTGELTIMLQNLDEKLVSLDGKLDKILEQTTKTNGRVSRVEAELGMGTQEESRVSYLLKEVETNKVWRWRIIGAWSVLVLLPPVVWFILSLEFKNYQKILEAKQTAEILKLIEDNNNKYFEK